ncbi:ATP-binding protein [Massilia sp.]|uniref:ATP-binding protein n=1 Tax=Massilia sp. TaxID=1882437 RepID=UPI002896B306|nr:ATP-binding protein [Massilia sp.]
MGIGSRVDTTEGQPPAKAAPARAFALSDPKYVFDDLILPRETRTQIDRALAFRRHQDLVFQQWGLKHTHRHAKRICLNFYGPPGTGKTMAAHAVANELGKKLLIVNYAEIESKYVGETPKNLVSLFRHADETDAVIFFDEADALLSKRVTNMSNATDTSVNQTRSVLLNLLNDYEKTILFATNFIENFDPAFMRRILAHVHFTLPDEICRRQLYSLYVPAAMPHTIDFEAIARVHDGLSGSDIANAVLLAAFSAAERGGRTVLHTDLDSAVRSILAGKHANAGKTHIVTREISAEFAAQAIRGNA